jgi:hypothetical protein
MAPRAMRITRRMIFFMPAPYSGGRGRAFH